MKVTWNDSFLVGDDIIDEQHQALFNLADIFLNNRHKSEFVNNVNKLLAHTKEHFDYEERLMMENNYFNYSKHKQEHSLILYRLTNVSKMLFDNMLDQELLDSLILDLLKKHIKEEDVALVNYISVVKDL